MKRRSVVLGLGAALTGAGGLFGTGAFTSVDADRTATVGVAGDNSGFLRLFPSPDPVNGSFASTGPDTTGNQLALDFDDEIHQTTNPHGGIGVGMDSLYVFDDVFRVENQGAQEVYVDITPLVDVDLQDAGNDGTQGDVTIEFIATDSGGSRHVIDGTAAELTVPVGTIRAVGVRIRTDDESTYGNVNTVTDSNQTNGTQAEITADDTIDSGNAIDPGTP
jgi:hypothetical protein